MARSGSGGNELSKAQSRVYLGKTTPSRKTCSFFRQNRCPLARRFRTENKIQVRHMGTEVRVGTSQSILMPVESANASFRGRAPRDYRKKPLASRPVPWKHSCTPGMGVNSWGASPLYVNPASVLLDICTSTSRRQGRNREGPSGGSRSAKRMSRRTETAYKAESPGKSARHDKAPGSGDTVNAAVAS